jgi:hypothetical protein
MMPLPANKLRLLSDVMTQGLTDLTFRFNLIGDYRVTFKNWSEFLELFGDLAHFCVLKYETEHDGAELPRLL